MNLPNKLTLFRIVCVPIFLAFYIYEMRETAAAVFLTAAITDALDGKIARKRGLVTNFGKIMDPLADKILVISAFVIMVEKSEIAGWMLIVILAREFMIAGLRTVAAADGTVIAAGTSGKVKTILQMIAVPLVILKDNELISWAAFADLHIYEILLWACIIMTVVSGAEYIYTNRQIFLKGGM